MNKIERIKMVKAMEFIARQINDEDVLYGWLLNGVADGDIAYGDLVVNPDDPEDMKYYIDDEPFIEMMELFLRVMSRAKKSGGLYCDNVCTPEPDLDNVPFGIVWWNNEDLRCALAYKGIEATDENVLELRDTLVNGQYYTITDCMIESGWEHIYDTIDDLKSDGKLK